MAFNSIQYIVFFPAVVLIYFIIPYKIRYIWLLAASYYFYMSWNAKYAFLMLFSTAVAYAGGLLIEFVKTRDLTKKKKMLWKKIFVAACFSVNLCILFYFKYFDFAFHNASSLLRRFGINLYQPEFDIILPVGISFYTFQALGYIMDVYRDKIYAEKNILKYALFISFFPQLVAGPIERSKNLLKQINTRTSFHVNNARYGLFTMAYGFILKMVVSDRIALVIDPILADYHSYHGMVVLVCIVLFAFQIYCDFHGYTQIAIGSARVLGFYLQENFNSPYLAGNVKDFWKRWHMSLTSWFTDYLYIPLGGNRKGRIRKYANTMIVFLFSGLWHGASWAYVAWGAANGLYLVLYDIVKPYFKKILACMKVNIAAGGGWSILSRIVTFLLIDYTWLYFRAEGLQNAFAMQVKIADDFYLPYLLSNDLLGIFGNYTNLAVMVISFLFLLYTDYLHVKGRDWKSELLGQQIFYRWTVYMAMLLTILIFGVYGEGNGQTQFIYFQF